MDKKRVIFITILLTILSLSIASAGWLDNRVESDDISMENIEGFYTDDAHNTLGAISMTNDEKKESIWISDANQTYPSESDLNESIILKNYTDENFVSYMMSNNCTLAFINIDNKIYYASLHHFSKSKDSVYNEEIFMQDNELLKKHMKTIKSK
ncbi:MAG: hypothetical protein IJI98_06320 [Methanosphaera sp.]|nr:hypothetical protein [Methanosphaera sp.]